ncbi:MAG: thioredoxin family protein [Bacteroidota bacterium]|nr:thioredoxin family protein [Bacteroidota bacterium]
MIKRFLLISITYLAIQINAQDNKLNWYDDVSKAIPVSIQENKPLLLFFTGSDWCGWCIRLKREVFNFPEFKEWTDDNVVLVELDFPRRKKLPENIMRQNRELANVFAVRGYPTVWIVKPEIIENSKVNFLKMGTLGYVAGGPKNWIAKANNFLPKQ